MKNYEFEDPRVTALDFPPIAEQLPYASGLTALTESVKDGGTPLHYDAAEDAYFDPVHPGDINVVGKAVALGTDNLYTPVDRSSIMQLSIPTEVSRKLVCEHS